ncbi:hypothetical protein [Nocardiopsis ganjiahuensis]|uniref:hypothetical protein n=1 Tax=Nocardiopsis ganjiahuensis TaxID=239984 RepID=UPI00034CC77F|nr:hypothetical protein [Nocardiopsis ganjiahuensis]
MNEHTEALASRLTQILNDPELCADAVTRLVSAKAVFGYLDDALRSGDALPTRWSNRWTTGIGAITDFHDVTDHYDALSEALRATGEPVTCWRALSTARDQWALLKAAMASGSPLPEPWQR